MHGTTGIRGVSVAEFDAKSQRLRLHIIGYRVRLNGELLRTLWRKKFAAERGAAPRRKRRHLSYPVPGIWRRNHEQAFAVTSRCGAGCQRRRLRMLQLLHASGTGHSCHARPGLPTGGRRPVQRARRPTATRPRRVGNRRDYSCAWKTEHWRRDARLPRPAVAALCRVLRYFFFPSSSPVSSTARNAFCGMSTWPIDFIRFLPSFCFSQSLRLRVMSPP